MNKKKQLIKKMIGFFLFLAIVIIGLDFWRRPDDQAIQTTLFTTLEQQEIQFTEDSPITILYFWGSWCVYCRHTSPAIERLHQQGYPVVSVALSSGTPAEVKAYLTAHHLNFPVVNDPDGTISQSFSVVATPTIAIVKKQKIVFSTTGLSSESGIKLRFWLATLW